MAERMTHAYEGDLAVFLIDRTINSRDGRTCGAGPVFAAMAGMLAELHADKAAADRGDQQWWGLHQDRTLMGGRGPDGRAVLARRR